MISFKKFIVLCLGFIVCGITCASILFTNVYYLFRGWIIPQNPNPTSVVIPLMFVFFICGYSLLYFVITGGLIEDKNIIGNKNGWVATNDNP